MPVFSANYFSFFVTDEIPQVWTTNGHEWVGGNHETHEIHERKNQNHEWTRMDTKSGNI